MKRKQSFQAYELSMVLRFCIFCMFVVYLAALLFICYESRPVPVAMWLACGVYCVGGLCSVATVVTRNVYDCIYISDDVLTQKRFGKTVKELPWAAIKEYGIKVRIDTTTSLYQAAWTSGRLPQPAGQTYYVYFSDRELTDEERIQINAENLFKHLPGVIAFEELHHHAIPGYTTVLYAAPRVQQQLQAHLPEFLTVCRSFNSTCKKLGLCAYWCGGQITTVEDLYQKIPVAKKTKKAEWHIWRHFWLLTIGFLVILGGFLIWLS